MMNFSEGSFLASAGQTSLTASPIDNTDGVIPNINDVLTSQNSASGSGDLVSFTFQIVGYGSSPIELTNVELLGPAPNSTDSNPQIPSTETNAIFTYDAQTTSTLTPSSLSNVISAVQSGTTSTSSISAGPNPDPFNTTVKIDIRIDNAEAFWGWTVSTVTWNPAVLQLIKVTDGPFLSDNTGGDPTTFVGNSKSLWDNTNGAILGGLSEAIGAPDTSTDSSGVLATLTFNVTGYGSSPITIGGGNLRLTSSDHTGVNVTCNSATVTSNNPSPTPTPSPSPSPSPSGPHGPVASFIPQNGTLYAVGSTVLLDASSSTPGYDSVICNITSYVWLIEYSNSSIFGSFSGQTISFNALSVAYLQITLIVTAPDLNSSPASSYTNTSTMVAWIQIKPAQQLTNIDVFTDKGGIGQNVNSGVYGSQELVKVYALVTYEGAPVTAGNLVGFAVFYPNGTVCALDTEQTNETGYAYLEFRLPPPSSNPESLGNWSIVASVGISSVVVTDTVNFTYSNVVNVIKISGIQLPASVARSGTLNMNVTVQGLNSTSLVSVTVCDEQEVPIACYTVNVTPAAGGSVTVPVSITIPSWAYVGTATVYADVMTNLPTAGGMPLCPEDRTTFQILS